MGTNQSKKDKETTVSAYKVDEYQGSYQYLGWSIHNLAISYTQGL